MSRQGKTLFITGASRGLSRAIGLRTTGGADALPVVFDINDESSKS